MRRTVLLFAVVFVLVSVTSAGASPPAEPGERRAVVETLFGDGSIGCPDHWADDLSMPVGKVVFRPVVGGIHFHVVLTDAAPNWEYEVVVNLELGDCLDWDAVQSFEGLVTNKNGAGVLNGTYEAEPGQYSIEVNVVSAWGPTTEPRHREIGPAGFTQTIAR